MYRLKMFIYVSLFIITSVLFMPNFSFAKNVSDLSDERKRSFNKADRNHDGRLSWPEFHDAVRDILSHRTDWGARSFMLLGQSEQEALLREHFNAMDIEKKGYLTFSEWKK